MPVSQREREKKEKNKRGPAHRLTVASDSKATLQSRDKFNGIPVMSRKGLRRRNEGRGVRDKGPMVGMGDGNLERRHVRSPALPVKVHHLRKALVPFPHHPLALEMHEVEHSEVKKRHSSSHPSKRNTRLSPFPPSGPTLWVLFPFLGGAVTRGGGRCGVDARLAYLSSPQWPAGRERHPLLPNHNGMPEPLCKWMDVFYQAREVGDVARVSLEQNLLCPLPVTLVHTWDRNSDCVWLKQETPLLLEHPNSRRRILKMQAIALLLIFHPGGQGSQEIPSLYIYLTAKLPGRQAESFLHP